MSRVINDTDYDKYALPVVVLDPETNMEINDKRPEPMHPFVDIDGLIADGKQFDLDMHLVNCEYTLDASKVIFMYTSESRVDFRELLKELASVFKCRIELRQIGIRDETKLLGGIAPCGRTCCCAGSVSEFGKVTIKMAKNQGLHLNPSKISGLCGRLMCCLGYENSQYEEVLD